MSQKTFKSGSKRFTTEDSFVGIDKEKISFKGLTTSKEIKAREYSYKGLSYCKKKMENNNFSYKKENKKFNSSNWVLTKTEPDSDFLNKEDVEEVFSLPFMEHKRLNSASLKSELSEKLFFTSRRNPSPFEGKKIAREESFNSNSILDTITIKENNYSKFNKEKNQSNFKKENFEKEIRVLGICSSAKKRKNSNPQLFLEKPLKKSNRTCSNVIDYQQGLKKDLFMRKKGKNKNKTKNLIFLQTLKFRSEEIEHQLEKLEFVFGLKRNINIEFSLRELKKLVAKNSFCSSSKNSINKISEKLQNTDNYFTFGKERNPLSFKLLKENYLNTKEKKIKSFDTKKLFILKNLIAKQNLKINYRQSVHKRSALSKLMGMVTADQNKIQTGLMRLQFYSKYKTKKYTLGAFYSIKYSNSKYKIFTILINREEKIYEAKKREYLKKLLLFSKFIKVMKLNQKMKNENDTKSNLKKSKKKINDSIIINRRLKIQKLYLHKSGLKILQNILIRRNKENFSIWKNYVKNKKLNFKLIEKLEYTLRTLFLIKKSFSFSKLKIYNTKDNSDYNKKIKTQKAIRNYKKINPNFSPISTKLHSKNNSNYWPDKNNNCTFG